MPAFSKLMVSITAKRQLKDKLNKLRELTWPKTPKVGWIRTLRDALDMSGSQLGERVNLTRNQVSILERKEADGTITIEQLEKLADGLNARVVYAVIPNDSIDETIEKRLREIATNQLRYTNRSMFLETQQLTQPQFTGAIDSLIAQLRAKGGRTWWKTDFTELHKDQIGQRKSEKTK